MLRFFMLQPKRVEAATFARRFTSKKVSKISAVVLGFATLSFAQNGPQIAVSPGIITTVASRSAQVLAAASFNGVAFKTPSTVFFSDSHITFVGGNTITNANIYALDLGSGQITRVAGPPPDPVNGNSGYSGDGGAAINAKLFKPAGLALDSAGNLYVADSGQNVVRKIDATTSVITTVAGNGNPILNVFSGDNGPATSAQLAFPTAIAFDSANNLYISDTFNHRVRMVNASTGIINTVAGDGNGAHAGDGGPAVNASLDKPLGIAVDRNNNLYIADSSQIPSGNEFVRKVSNGTISSVASQLSNPYDVAVDQAGTVYISDSGHFKILRLATDGQITTVAGNGSAGPSGDGGPAISAALSGPANLTVSPAGDIYFVDSGTQPTVRRITGNPAPAVFPLTAVGNSNSTTITVSATGNQNLNVSQINLPTNFTLTGGSCGTAPFTLSAGTSCTLVLTLTPTAGGPTSGTLRIVSDAVNSATTSVLLSMSNGLYFVPVTPCRVVDTRLPNGDFGGPVLAANQSRSFAIRFSNTVGCSNAPVPANADVQAYSLNITVVPRRTLTYLTVWPGGDRPLVSTLNSYQGRTKANAMIIPANTSDNNRGISVFGTDDTDLIIDINGYYVPQSTPSSLAFYPLPPCRAVDTRESALASGLGAPAMQAGETRSFPLQSSGCNLPSSAQAYALTFTALPKSSKLAYLTVWPSGSDRPVVSTLNATPGSTSDTATGTVTANAAIVPAGSGGQISAFTTDAADLIIDVSGYYAPPTSGGLGLYNVTPCRAFDSRNPGGSQINGVFNVNVSGGCNVPATAQSFVVNATVVPAASLSYLTLWARGSYQPLQSTLNAFDAKVTSNLAVVPTVDGYVSAFTTARTDLILDVFGYFAP